MCRFYSRGSVSLRLSCLQGRKDFPSIYVMLLNGLVQESEVGDIRLRSSVNCCVNYLFWSLCVMHPGCTHPLYFLSQQFLKQQIISKKTASSLTWESAVVRLSHPSDDDIRDSAPSIRYRLVLRLNSGWCSASPFTRHEWKVCVGMTRFMMSSRLVPARPLPVRSYRPQSPVEHLLTACSLFPC